MDGPPNVALLCHAILSGTHVILRPSWRDVVSHWAFDILYDNGLVDYAQLVRWDSCAANSPSLCRTLFRGVAQNLLFSSDETFQELLQLAAGGDSVGYRELLQKTRRYGTGLPLCIVTSRCDVTAAARDLVTGCRLGGGKFCLSTTPVLVEECSRKALTAKLVELASTLKSGDLLDPATELCQNDPDHISGIRSILCSFGGERIHGTIPESEPAVVIVEDVEPESPCLHQEVPYAVLCLIPFQRAEQAVDIARRALRRNGRDAWTALTVYGSDDDTRSFAESIPAYRVLHGGVAAEDGLLMPHQGSYFVREMMQQVSFEGTPGG